MLNGVDTLIMMKADVLNSFGKIKACTKYKTGGEIHEEFPFELSTADLEPVYQEMEGWNTPLDKVSSYDTLPSQLAAYIRFIEKDAGLPIEMVSIGPDRVQTLKK
jgi:adenylosuccinate synthase